MRLNTTSGANGVSLTNGSRVGVDFDGMYNIQFSTQLILTGGGNSSDDIDIWLNVNGLPLADSNTSVTLDKSNARSVAAWNFMVPLNAGDYVQLMWYSTTGKTQILVVPPTGGRPSIPSLILTINQVGA